MLIGMLVLLSVAQGTTVGPPLSPGPHPTAVVRTDDATVLGAIGAADANEIEAATLGTKKASDGDAKAYAAMVLHDHELSLTAGANLATRFHIVRLLPADSALARAHKEEMARLNTLTGDEFDRAFVQMMVTNHSIAMARVTGGQVTLAKRLEVKAFVRQRLPVLTKHKATGEAWLKAHP